jgi:hypothetical protein
MSPLRGYAHLVSNFYSHCIPSGLADSIKDRVSIGRKTLGFANEHLNLELIKPEGVTEHHG